jgi:hypothetical protein
MLYCNTPTSSIKIQKIMIKNLILGIVTLSLFSCGTSVDLTPIALPKDKIEMLGSLGSGMEINGDTQLKLTERENDILVEVPLRFKFNPNNRDAIQNIINDILVNCQLITYSNTNAQEGRTLDNCAKLNANLSLSNSQGLPIGVELRLYSDDIKTLYSALETGSEEVILTFMEYYSDSKSLTSLKDVAGAHINLVISRE